MGGFRLRVIDVSNPAAPVELGVLNTWGYLPRDVEVVGDLAYVPDEYGLHIFDVSNPAFPLALGAFDMPSVARDVEVVGDLAPTWPITTPDCASSTSGPSTLPRSKSISTSSPAAIPTALIRTTGVSSRRLSSARTLSM
jgi:hypothetical protein